MANLDLAFLTYFAKVISYYKLKSADVTELDYKNPEPRFQDTDPNSEDTPEY